MASWLKHPSYVPVRDGLINHLPRARYRFRRLDPVVFICGGKGSKSRDALRAYLQKFKPDLGIFYAERVWEHIARRGERDALQMEAELGNLADLVIIIVESPGTFAELAAFSLSPELGKKLLPIVDEKFRDQSSFISLGPLRWIDKMSDFKPTIYVPLREVLRAVDQIEERVRRIPKSGGVKISDLAISPKHLLFFLCDLIAMIYPATIEVIEYYLDQISPTIQSSGINVPTLVGLGVEVNLLRTHKQRKGGRTDIYYAPAVSANANRPFHHGRMLSQEDQRVAHASVLLTIPQARVILSRLGKRP